MAQGLQIWDASGNLILDTSDNTIKEVGHYAATVTAPTPITDTTITDASEVLVVNNVDTLLPPKVSIDRVAKKLYIQGNYTFNADVRIIDY